MRTTMRTVVMAAVLAATGGAIAADQSTAPGLAGKLFSGVRVQKDASGLLAVKSPVMLSADGRFLMVAGKPIDLALMTPESGGAPGVPAGMRSAEPPAALPPTAAPGVLPGGPSQMPPTRTVDFKTLPLDKAITISKGDGSREFAVFSDVNCSFCRRLEATLASMDNYKVHILMLPVIAPDSRRVSDAIWCAGNAAARAKAWSSWWETNKAPDGPACDTPIQDLLALGQQLAVNGTPTLVRFTDGQLLPGAMPKEFLESWIAGR